MAKAQEWVEDSVGLNQKDRIIKQIVYNLILIFLFRCKACSGFFMRRCPHIFRKIQKLLRPLFCA